MILYNRDTDAFLPMSPERLSRIEELYHGARERKPSDRGAFLADACQGDLELQAEIESLLVQQSESLFDQPAWEQALEHPPDSPPAGHSPQATKLVHTASSASWEREAWASSTVPTMRA